MQGGYARSSEELVGLRLILPDHSPAIRVSEVYMSLSNDTARTKADSQGTAKDSKHSSCCPAVVLSFLFRLRRGI
jgi:hypothetical protein